ncbi:MAG: hypothetical protein ING75_03840 [Rhodocyclaceae bacterium]|nr:hypothetical protein [Rhodocyclaceae bacterium]
MSLHEGFIVERPLPEALDAESLKHEGIAMLQKIAGSAWTNFNDSDPGVTVLDQLCYALTELGYCSQFPIEDVLTQEDGKISYGDQFFEPQEILTCSPVVPDDYRKLVHDAMPEIRAIYIRAELVRPTGSQELLPTGRYTSGVCLEADTTPTVQPDFFLPRLQQFLNQNRNLGEYFLLPILLRAKVITLGGSIVLAPSAELEKVTARILTALNEYAVPPLVQSGYHELLAEGLHADQIFNGPKLANGWIAKPGALSPKRTEVRLCDLAPLISAIDGVQEVESLYFVGRQGTDAGVSKIDVADHEFPAIALSAEVLFKCNDVTVEVNQGSMRQQYLERLSATHQAASVSSSIDLYPTLPNGTFRNIEEYYSVQNTFPEIYGIGPNVWRGHGDPYRNALSRQLQGYLMAFDQLLANEFSQLANVSTLFSFGLPPPADGITEMTGLPWRKFSTTYHCQPLYDIPHVKPLLLGNDAFRFRYETSRSEVELDAEAWKRFCAFPFNEYVCGLRKCLENDTEALIRRDGMLTHLMARHGVDANLYDGMIDQCQWFGDERKTRIVVKTIWLQNFALLSYHRSRAFDVDDCRRLPKPGESFNASPTTTPAEQSAHPATDLATRDEPLGMRWWRAPAYPDIDGEVDQRQIYSDARLSSAEFKRFSAFELKAGILLGLPRRLRVLAGTLWALLNDSGFEHWLRQPTRARNVFSLPNSDISVHRGSGSADLVFAGARCVMEIAGKPNNPPSAGDYQAHLDQLSWLATQTQGFLLVESILFPGATIEGASNTSSYADVHWPFLSAWLQFPKYVTFMQQEVFKEFLQTLLNHHWPAHVNVHCQFVSFEILREVINAYVERIRASSDASGREAASTKLLNHLVQTKTLDAEGARA